MVRTGIRGRKAAVVSCDCSRQRSHRRRGHGQVLVFGGFNGRVRRGAAAIAAEQRVQAQLGALVQENAELRRMYKHMETQLTFAAEELSGALSRRCHVPAVLLLCVYMHKLV